MTKQELVSDVGLEVIEIVKKYAKTWEILLRYDEDRLEPTTRTDNLISLNYNESKAAIDVLKKNLMKKNEASELFGIERDDALAGILGNIVQTFDSIPIYASNLERAANLLYFIIKDHPFTDGNKRIGCLLFLIYLKKISYNTEIDNNSLVAIALLIAESAPTQKEIMVSLVRSMLE